MGGAAHDLVSAPELWRGAGTTLVVANALVLVQVRSATRVRRRHPHWSWTAPAISLLAAFAAYTCVPDTERALWVLGATGGAAVVAIVLRQRWPVAALLVTVALVWVALEDGSPRDSALVGTLGIAGLHLVLQHRVTAAPRAGPVLVAVAAVAMGLAARVAGRGDGVLRPLLLGAGLLVATASVARLAARRSVRR